MTPPTPEGIPGDIEYLRLPRPAELFERRAKRLRELAPGHPMGELLEALADLAKAQRSALSWIDASPGAAELPAEVPLRATSWQRHRDWLACLSFLVGELRRGSWPGPAQAALGKLSGASPQELEALANDILAGAPAQADLAAALFVAAALQVYFTALAATLLPARVARSHSGCPVCGSPPVAGVVLGDDKLRYLTCSLCGSEWNLTRIQCWLCRKTGGISYLSLEGTDRGLRAEACASCGGYLKLFYRERSPKAEPLADDLASLALDFAAAEEGWARSGVNLFLIGGTGARVAPRRERPPDAADPKAF
jgi:FdhE protein